MDNHFAYATWALPGLIDDIHSKLAGHHTKYHGDRIDVAHVSTFTAAQLEGVEMDGNYSMTLWMPLSRAVMLLPSMYRCNKFP